MLNNIFTAEVLNLPANLKSRKSYERAVKALGWEVVEWDENPMKEQHPHSPIYVKIKTNSGQSKDFLILRSGNSATFAVIKEMNGEPHVLVRKEAKGTGINITTMPSGYMKEGEDKSLYGTALRKLFEEAGIKVNNYVAVNNSAASMSNNSTNTSTSFLVEVSKDSEIPNGWEYIPLKDAPARINHLPSQQTAYAACSFKKLMPEHQFITLEA
jgi:8-oxo-dGTP pyrophosphatase MutT (NUDIX family)